MLIQSILLNVSMCYHLGEPPDVNIEPPDVNLLFIAYRLGTFAKVHYNIHI